MSQNNRRTSGSKFTGCPKASKIRQLESALDYAHRAIRSLNKDLRKLGIAPIHLYFERVLTEEQRNAELLLKKQDEGRKKAKLQELKLQKVFIQHLLNAVLEKVLATSAPALAERKEKDLGSSCGKLQEEREAFVSQIAEQTKSNAAKDALLAELKRQIGQTKTRPHCTAESQTCSPSTKSIGTECTTECAEADVQATSEVTVVSVETQTDAVPKRHQNRAVRTWQSFCGQGKDCRKMSQNNRRTSGSKFTGCPKASKIRQLESALDYAHRAIRSLNKEHRKLGIENDVLRSGLQDENRVLTEEQRNAELLLKKQDEGRKKAKLQELKLQKVFIQHLLNAVLEKVLATSAPALAERRHLFHKLQSKRRAMPQKMLGQDEDEDIYGGYNEYDPAFDTEGKDCRKMSQNNRRTSGSKFTGCPKASKIRQLESALDYAHRAIRSLNKEHRKLGIENDVLRSGLQDENRFDTEIHK
ncbi:predicted protein [Nematostella vectensis]|uniref:Uncharacterized protein n=1 Tax=Nematostella vectensis TaxID=45351 RepID=A7T155_NEMVE|nr:predicted protein [Nematostella vectensis]|eukprot:XP_001622413.1 hypothetical protein NEMVEDRAFT_v1g220753 [Nematostella vectensis]